MLLERDPELLSGIADERGSPAALVALACLEYRLNGRGAITPSELESVLSSKDAKSMSSAGTRELLIVVSLWSSSPSACVKKTNNSKSEQGERGQGSLA